MDDKKGQRPRHRPVDHIKRLAILDTAREEFFSNGFAHASIETIAAKSGVSKVTIYNRFGTKEALFTEVVERECVEIAASFQPTNMDDRNLCDSLMDFAEKGDQTIDAAALHTFRTQDGCGKPTHARIG